MDVGIELLRYDGDTPVMIGERSYVKGDTATWRKRSNPLDQQHWECWVDGVKWIRADPIGWTLVD